MGWKWFKTAPGDGFWYKEETPGKEKKVEPVAEEKSEPKTSMAELAEAYERGFNNGLLHGSAVPEEPDNEKYEYGVHYRFFEAEVTSERDNYAEAAAHVVLMEPLVEYTDAYVVRRPRNVKWERVPE